MGREGGSSLLCLENYVSTRKCWHVTVNGSVPCVVPRMIEAVSELHGLSLFGRQDAWRLVCIRGGVVMIVVGTVCWLLFAVACFLGSIWGRGGGGSCSVVKLLGGRVAIVVCRQIVDDTVQSPVVCGCVFSGSVCGGSSSVVKLLGARVQSGLCCQLIDDSVLW